MSIEKLKDNLRDRQRAYQVTFSNEAGKAILRDLAKFCRAHQPTFHADPRVHAALDGRREVWLRIEQHLKLSDEDIWNLYDGRK